MQSQIAGQGTESGGGIRRDPRKRWWHRVEPGLHRAGITRMPHGPMQAQAAACRGLRPHARCTAQRRGAVAVALTHGRHGGVGGVDDVAVGQGLALRAPSRWRGDPLLRREGCGELMVQALAWGRSPLWSPAHICVGGRRQGPDRIARCQHLPRRLPDQPHKHVPQAPALAATATPDLVAVVRKWWRFQLPRGARGSALDGDGGEALEDVC